MPRDRQLRGGSGPDAPDRASGRARSWHQSSRPAAQRPTITRMATTQPSRNLGRLSEIAQVAARHGFGYVVRRKRAGDLSPDANGDAATSSDRGRRLRMMLDELGPTFVKFGQLLSTRPDVVPPDIVT